MNKIKLLVMVYFVFLSNCIFALENPKNPVYHPLKAKPNYEFKGNESIDEMRKRTVQVMRDTLTFTWSPKKSFSYSKTNAGEGIYNFNEGKIYANLPYTTGCSGLFQWLYFYDYQTGIFDYCDWPNIGKKLGNSCAASVAWATSATCSSIAKGKSGSSNTMTIYNGWQPLGNYNYPKNLDFYSKTGTNVIIAQNPKNIIFEAYALLKEADILVFYKTGKLGKSGGHAMMVIERPFIVRNPKTKAIDGNLSYVTIQDQGGVEYTKNSNGLLVSCRGGIGTKYTFNKLYKKTFLPMTTLEYSGKKPFEKSYCDLKGNYSDLKSLQNCTIETNYRLAVIVCEVKNLKGDIVYNMPYTINGKNVSSGIASNFPLKTYLTDKLLKEIKSKSKEFTVKLMVTLSNGKDYVLLDTTKFF